MDDWSFISLAKTKSDLGLFARTRALAKADTAVALDSHLDLESGSLRGVVALATSALVTAAFFGAVESSALHAHTPKGEVIVAEVMLDEATATQVDLSSEQAARL